MPSASWPSGSIFSNPVADQLAQLFGPQLMAPGLELGQFQPNQNLLDTQSARQFAGGRMNAVSGMSSAGAASSFQELIMGRQPGAGLVGLGGLSSAQGQQFGQLTQSADFGRTMGGAMSVMGMLAPNMMGGVADALGMGSGYAAGNYYDMFRGQMATPGQPGTGMSPSQMTSTATQIAGGLQQDLFSGNKPSATRGYEAGKMSDFLGPAQQMGRGPGDFAGMSREQRRGYVSGLSKSASAIRDLGGEFANMSPQQTLQAVDMFNMGGFSRGVGNEQLEQQTRMFKQLTRQGGGDIDQNMRVGLGLQQIAGARSVQLGGDALSGVTAGQHGMAFGNYAKGQGAEFIASAGTSAVALMQQDAILTAQAGRSEIGNLASSLMRMGEGGLIRDKESPAFKAYERLKNEGKFDIQDPGTMQAMLRKSGVNMGTAAGIMQQRGKNAQMYGDEVAGAVREQQWELDIQPVMQGSIAGSLQQGARGAGKPMSGPQSMALAKMITDTMRDMGGRDLGEVKQAIVSKFIEMGASEEDANAAAMGAMGAAGEAVRTRGYTQGLGQATALHGRGGMQAVRDQQATGQKRVDKEIEMAHEAQKGPFGRFIDAIKDSSSMSEFLSKVAGGVEIDKRAAGGDRADKQAEDQEKGTDAKQEGAGGATAVEVTNAPGTALTVRIDDGDASAGPTHGAGEQPGDTGGVG